MTSHEKEIIAHFARWVSASAARQGPHELRGKKSYQYVDTIKLIEITAPKKSVSSEEFATWHKRTVESLSQRAHVPIGWAAKIVNMVAKVRIYLAKEGHPSLRKLIHPPLDNQLIDEIVRVCRRSKDKRINSKETIRLIRQAKPIKGIKTYKQYTEVITGLQLVASHRGHSLFELELLWKG